MSFFVCVYQLTLSPSAHKHVRMLHHCNDVHTSFSNCDMRERTIAYLVCRACFPCGGTAWRRTWDQFGWRSLTWSGSIYNWHLCWKCLQCCPLKLNNKSCSVVGCDALTATSRWAVDRSWTTTSKCMTYECDKQGNNQAKQGHIWVSSRDVSGKSRCLAFAITSIVELIVE